MLQEASAAGIRLTIKRLNGDILLSYTPTGTYLLKAATRRIVFDGTPGDIEWEHRLVSLAIPLLLAEQGDLSLHASAVAGPSGGAVLFCGPTGRGKSTAAAILAGRGYELLSEDGAVVNGVDTQPHVWPGPLGVLNDLCPDGLEEWSVHSTSTDPARLEPVADPPPVPWRNRVLRLPPAPIPGSEPHPVKAVVALARRAVPDPSSERVRPYAPTDGLAALLPAALHADPSRRRAVLPRLARLVERVPVYRVSLPDGLTPAAAALESFLARVA